MEFLGVLFLISAGISESHYGFVMIHFKKL